MARTGLEGCLGVFCGLLLVHAAAGSARAQQPECNGVVYGRVVDASTGEGLQRAQVALAGGEARSTTADNGDYRLSGLCPGPVKVAASRADYEPGQRAVRVLRAGEQRLDLALDPRKVTRLDDVVVETLVSASPEARSSTTLSGEALERTRGRGLADAISSVPGVTLLGSGATAKPIIRGQFGRRLLIVVDGVRHEGQKWGLDHAPEVDPFLAGEITVTKGPSGVRWGPDAIGGVIEVQPRPLPVDDGVSANVTAVGTTNARRGTLAARVEGTHDVLPGLAWRVDGNVSRGAALSTPDYHLGNTGVFEWNAGTTLGYASDLLDLKVALRRHVNETGQCRCIRAESPGDFFAAIEDGRPLLADLFEKVYEIDRAFQDVLHDTALSRLSVDLGRVGTATCTYAFQRDERLEYARARRNVTAPQANFDLRTHFAELAFEQAPVNLGPGVLSGTAGVVVQRQTQVFRGLPFMPDFRNLSLGVFVLEQYALDSVQLTGGVRFDSQALTGFLDNDLFGRHARRGILSENDCDGTDSTTARCEREFSAYSGSLGAVWLARKDTNIKADISVAQRFPLVDELYINGSAPTFPVVGIGKPDLGVETTRAASVTGLFENDWLFVELSVFGSLVDDYIYFAPDILPDGTPGLDVNIRGTFPRFATSAIDAAFYGTDGGVRVKTPWSVWIEGQFALVRGHNRTGDGFLFLVPADRYDGKLTYRLPNLGQWQAGFVGLSGTYVARQDRSNDTIDFAPAPDGYFLLGASAGIEREWDAVLLRTSLEASNLLNRRYREYTSLLRYYADEPGVDVRLRFGADF